MVKAETIPKYFENIGILDTLMEAVTCRLEEDSKDPLLASSDAYL